MNVHVALREWDRYPGRVELEFDLLGHVEEHAPVVLCLDPRTGHDVDAAVAQFAYGNCRLRVGEDSIVEALKLMVTRSKLAAEPSGAAALAALLEDPPELRGLERVVCVVSGGNVDPQRLAGLIASEPR